MSDLTLDTTINLKINSELKKDFERICKENHSNISREIKLFMSDVVKKNSLDIYKPGWIR